MKIIETTFEKMSRERLLIGFEGENQRATVRIDCASVFAEYPNATPALTVKPLFADAYPVVVDRNGTCVDWLITSEILSFTGDGEIQLTFHKDAVICKSAIAKIRVCRSLQVTGDMPDPVAQWVDDANAKLAEVDAQIVELEEMVDTATDAATRAEQSASTASTKAEQAATSAATATAKATEATTAAGTATAKAAEAQTAAQTATSKATAAAESERIATAKAGEATTAASTATTNATEATEAAETATEKAGEASASATAAHASEINAAESADDALSAEVGANAAKRAAETSATQAGTSAQNAGTAAQTATQKAAEASQSATNAATFAGTATTKAEEAAASAQAAQDAQTAVEQTAEQLADSLEQIDQNTQDIAELDERKANIDGYYPDMTVGNAEQLNSSKYVENSEPYTLRTSGGTSDIGNREYVDAVVGGTLAWNQAVRDEASENSTDFAPIVTVTDAVEDAAGVKVKIEPVQDLHGYDHPWPAGGGKNLVNIPDTTLSTDGSTGNVSCALPAGTYTFAVTTSTQVAWMCRIRDADGNNIVTPASSASLQGRQSVTFTISQQAYFVNVYFNAATVATDFQIESGSTATEWTPFSNICPISGWDGVQVTRTGKNLLDESNLLLANGWTVTDGVYSGVNSALHSAFINGFPGMVFKPDTTYTVSLVFRSATASKITVIGFNYTDGTHSTAYMQDTVEHTVSFTSTSGKSVSNLLLSYGAGDTVYISQMQVEEGSTATAYEPYAGQTYSITLPSEAGTVYGGTLTVNADGSGSLVVDRAEVDLGTPNWSYNSDALRFDCTNSKIIGAKSVPNSEVPNAYCTQYDVVKYNDNYGVAGSDNIVFFDHTLLRVRDKRFTDATAFKTAMQGVKLVYELATPITYTLTATQVQTLLGTNNVWSDAGQVALTYTGTDEHLTLESGKKYLARISGTDSMLLGSGQEITAAKGTDNVFDLTRMFGTAVADYVYGQGAAFFRKWFPNAVYPYNAGGLLSVEGLQSHDMVGFNLFDKSTATDGKYINGPGTEISDSTKGHSAIIPVFPSTYYYCTGYAGQSYYAILWLDGNERPITDFSGASKSAPFTARSPANARYAILNYHIALKDSVCFNLSHNGSRNGEYAPYEKHSYPLDSTVILRGIPKVGSNGVYWDGDRYLPDGTVERRYVAKVLTGAVDERWQVYATSTICNRFSLLLSDRIPTADSTAVDTTFIVYGMTTISKNTTGSAAAIGKVSGWDRGGTGLIFNLDPSVSLEQFKASLAENPLYLVYELATPTIEQAQPYHSTQWVSDWGTEEFVSTSIVPVGTETRYPANLRDKLQHLPDAASGNGSYLISQTDGQMVLTPFPAPPSTAGNYVLKATVVNGVATYTWEVAT